MNRLALALVLLSPFAVADPADVSRQVLGALWSERALFLSVCLQPKFSPVCRLDSDETALLNRIVDDLPREAAAPGFDSETANPRLFLPPGETVPRTAVTGDNVGDEVIFNTDRLTDAGHHPFTPFFATSLIAHELAHHHGLSASSSTDHERIERFAAKVQKGLEAASLWRDLSEYGQPQIHIFSLNAWTKRAQFDGYPVLWVIDDRTFGSFEHSIPQTEICDVGHPNRGFALDKWVWSDDLLQDNRDGSIVFTPLGGGVATCADASLNGPAQIQMPMKVVPDQPTTDKDWYKKAPGHFILSEVFVHGRNSRSDLSELTFHTETAVPSAIRDAGDFTVTGLLDVKNEGAPDSCAGELYARYFSTEAALEYFTFDRCEIARVDDQHYRLTFKHHFLASSFARPYYLGHISLHFAASGKNLQTIPDVIPGVDVTNSQAPAPMRFSQVEPFLNDQPMQPNRDCNCYLIKRTDPVELRLDIWSPSQPIEAGFLFNFKGTEGEGLMAYDVLSGTENGIYIDGRETRQVGPGHWQVRFRPSFQRMPYHVGDFEVYEIIVTNRQYDQGGGKPHKHVRFVVGGV